MTQAQGFEIGNLDAADAKPATFNVDVMQNEDGEGIVGFTIVGKNSPEYQNASNKVRIENIKRASKRSKQLDTSTDDGAAVVAKTVAANEQTLAMAVTVGWYGFNLEGAPMNFDKAVVEKLFTKYPQWQAMVNAALDNDVNFMKV